MAAIPKYLCDFAVVGLVRGLLISTASKNHASVQPRRIGDDVCLPDDCAGEFW